ncbi:hypothetical protein KVT40_005074 [Elsinoe batatas]|uniref:Uncharacterized protein n=1 Tax=Elsinoe batatas TaxID=2601811 RepID=A0A8K0L4J8_9PEZI|nr:hypothetical protein KVT40_005074 [Elsinoe batatas]
MAEYDEATRRVSEYVNGIVHKGWPVEKMWECVQNPVQVIRDECEDVFSRLALGSDDYQGRPFSDLCRMRTYHVDLEKGEAGRLEVVVRDGEVYAPGFGIRPLPRTELPASCKDVKQIEASKVTIMESERYPAHGRVEVDGIVRWVKPRSYLWEDFDKELPILVQLRQLRQQGSEMRVSNLAGLVVFQQGVVGMLLDYIEPSGVASETDCRRVKLLRIRHVTIGRQDHCVDRVIGQTSPLKFGASVVVLNGARHKSQRLSCLKLTPVYGASIVVAKQLRLQTRKEIHLRDGRSCW